MTHRIRDFLSIILATAGLASPAWSQTAESSKAAMSSAAPAPESQTVTLKATLLKDGVNIQSELNWTVTHKETGEVVFENMDAASAKFEGVSGDYTANVIWTGWPHKDGGTSGDKRGTKEFKINTVGPTDVIVPIQLDIPVTLEADNTIGEGEQVKVRWSGPDRLEAQISTNRVDDSEKDYIYGISAQRGRDAYEKDSEKEGVGIDSNDDGKFDQDDIAEALIAAPSYDGEYEIRYTLNNPPLILARIPLKVTDGKYSLRAPENVRASEAFTVQWSGNLTKDDFISIETVGTEAAFTATGKGPELKAGAATVQLTAPAAPGDYELRYILANNATAYDGMQAAIQATARIKVIAVDADVNGPEEVKGSAIVTFDVSPAGESWEDDYVSIIKPGAIKFNRDSWIELGKQKENPGKQASFQAPAIAGNYELAYFLAPGDRVLVRKPIKVVLAEATVKAPDTVKAGEAFDVSYTGDAHRGDRIIICPADTPDSAMWRWGPNTGIEVKKGETVGTYTEALSNRNLLGKPGEYEARYVTGKQNVILARDAFKVTK